ncbi:TonB family protein [Spongiibacter tropicus]|uniref:energy transducer TonB n=2 Tax=Spongiibacter TaxID=630749 RepID=UPI00300B5273
MPRVSWPIAIAVSLLIHGGLAIGYWQSRPAPHQGGAIGEGEYGFEIGLGMAGSYTDAVARQKAKQRQQEAEAEKQRERQQREAKAKQEARKPKPEPKPEPKPKPKAPAPVVAKTAEPSPAEADYQHSETPPAAESPSPAPAAEPPKQNTVASAEPNDTQSQASRKATGSGSQQKLGGRPGAARDYFSTLMAWLNHHKRYPKIAKKNKEQGIVKLKFTIAKDGSISNASIHTGSGHRRLDEAAMKMLREADPVPGIPDDLGRDTLTLVIPVEYSLITNNSYVE